MPSLFTTLLCLLAAATAFPTPVLPIHTNTTCAPIHTLAARGTLEEPGVGDIGALIELVQQTHPAATAEAVEYPATLLNYTGSEHEGMLAAGRQFAAYVDQCPETQMVMMGLSQGASVVLDSLCGSALPGYVGTGPSIGPELGMHGMYYTVLLARQVRVDVANIDGRQLLRWLHTPI